MFRTHRPLGQLSQYVEYFWFWRGATSATPTRRLPDGASEIVVALGPTALRMHDTADGGGARDVGRLIVCGARSRMMLTASSEAAVGVHFRPGGCFPFLEGRADELENAHAPIDEVCCASSTLLLEQLLEAGEASAMFAILERWLLRAATRRMERHPAVSLALRHFTMHPQACSVGEVARLSGISQRRFIARFREEVGMTPKRFVRVRRFQESLAMIDGSKPDWTAIATACGYYDQGHFIRDFKAFSGLTPAHYAAACVSRSNSSNTGGGS